MDESSKFIYQMPNFRSIKQKSISRVCQKSEVVKNASVHALNVPTYSTLVNKGRNTIRQDRVYIYYLFVDLKNPTSDVRIVLVPQMLDCKDLTILLRPLIFRPK